MELQPESGLSRTDSRRTHEPIATPTEQGEPTSAAAPSSALDNSLSQALLKLPVEAFALVLRYVLPTDVLHLARTNKGLRNLLMNESNAYIWANAIQNVPGLPLCPSHLSAPKYITLVFGNACTVCEQHVEGKMDPRLYVTLCPRCEPKALVSKRDVFECFHDLLSWSDYITPASYGIGPGPYTLIGDLHRLQEGCPVRTDNGTPAGGTLGLKEDPWYKDKYQAQREREKHELAMVGYLRPMIYLRCGVGLARESMHAPPYPQPNILPQRFGGLLEVPWAPGDYVSYSIPPGAWERSDPRTSRRLHSPPEPREVSGARRKKSHFP